MKGIKVTAVLAFTAAFGFFQLAYPYHLIRREQMSLFIYDLDYISQTYSGAGWFARLVGDFLEQFFLLPVVGPLFIALLLTAIGIVTYRILRRFIGQWPSLIAAAAMYLWSFMRETGNLYTTRYTIVVLGYLSLILLALQFNGICKKLISAILFVGVGVLSLGAPFHKHYGKIWSVPKFEYERLIGLDAEMAREHWDKVLKLSRKDLQMVEASYCYNLAQAMKGELGNTLFDHSQGGPYDLLLSVDGGQSVFRNCLGGEAWFHLGSNTIAEQSAITSLQASPNHTGARYILRLAKVGLISGNYAAAQKYLNLLSKTLFYGKWARSMMGSVKDEKFDDGLTKARSNLAITDFVHLSNVPRSILLGLLEANPENTLARNYLLCYDLMRYDLEQFMEDYTPYMIDAKIYHEAILIWLDRQGKLSEETASEYGIDPSLIQKMKSFFRMPGKYKNTYWYYYLEALNANVQ